MKNKILVVLALVLFSNIVFAQTPELINLIDKYYAASEKADAQITINLLYYPEETAAWFIENEKKDIQTKFASKQLKYVEYDFVKEEIFNEGKNAYVETNITGGQVYYPDKGTSANLTKETIFFVFEKQNNQWKILNFSVKASDFVVSQKEEYVKSFKEAFFASIEKQKGFDLNPPGGSDSNQNALVGLINSLIGLVSIGIIIVIILIVFFSLTGRKKDKSEDQTVVVNVQAPASQSTETQTIQKATEQMQTTMTKKEYSDAMKILRKRYASGEINKQQFDEMKKELEG